MSGEKKSFPLIKLFMSVCFLQLSVAMTTRREHPMLSGRRGRSRTRDGWWWTAPVWEREMDASHAPPEVRNPSSISFFSINLACVFDLYGAEQRHFE